MKLVIDNKIYSVEFEIDKSKGELILLGILSSLRKNIDFQKFDTESKIEYIQICLKDCFVRASIKRKLNEDILLSCDVDMPLIQDSDILTETESLIRVIQKDYESKRKYDSR